MAEEIHGDGWWARAIQNIEPNEKQYIGVAGRFRIGKIDSRGPYKQVTIEPSVQCRTGHKSCVHDRWNRNKSRRRGKGFIVSSFSLQRRAALR